MEEFRDIYKNSKYSNDFKQRFNGSTYRRIRSELNHSKMGNIIVIENNGKMNELEDINQKYGMNRPNLVYSLNKKKRWQVAKELDEKMNDFNDENIDVRLYETRNRNEKKANCVAIKKSHGENLKIKKTYANLESIKAKDYLSYNQEYVQYQIEYMPKNDTLRYGNIKFKSDDRKKRKKNFNYQDYYDFD